MRDAVVVSLLSLVPRNLVARCMGLFARTGLSRAVTGLFVRAYGVDMDEAEHGRDAYPTLEALFTRRLRAGARPIDPAPGTIVSPVDGTAAFVGCTVDGAFDVAPGRPLRLDALLGQPADGERDVVVLYLSPRDYHRVHVPREGVVRAWSYLPGTLWPVFPAAVRSITGLFARNERLVVHTDTDAGPLHVVLVGAFGVGRISAVFTDLLSNAGAPARSEACQPPFPLERGGDLGVFHLGSTVVLVAPPGAWAWSVRAGEVVQVGRRIGELAERR